MVDARASGESLSFFVDGSGDMASAINITKNTFMFFLSFYRLQFKTGGRKAVEEISWHGPVVPSENECQLTVG